MERIDLYIQEVTRRLPEKSRMEIEMELKSTILDMMPDDYTEADVNVALQQLGNPAKLANQYHERPNYLIGPKFYDSYITILKMSATIAVIIGLIVGIIDNVLTRPDDITLLESVISFISGSVGNILIALMNVFAWTTLTFAMLDRLVDDASMKQKAWTPEELKHVKPIEPKRQISKGEIFFSLFWTAFWATLYFKASEILGIYEKSKADGKLEFVEPLFNQEVLLSFWPVAVAFIAYEIGMALYKWMVGRWTKKIAALNLIYHIAIVIFGVIFINHDHVFNIEFIQYMGDLFNVKDGNLQSVWNKVVYGVVLIVIVTSGWDSLDGFRKARK